MSTITVQLIPLAFINEACNVSININEKEMKPNLVEAQEDLRALLGAEFYDEIESQYSGQSFTSANDSLYEGYIRNFLAWHSYLYSLGFAQSKSTPTGEREFNDDNSSLISDIKLVAKEKNIKRRAEKYKSAMIDFLRLEQSKNSTAYPKWRGYCEEKFSFGITSVQADSTEANIFSVNKATVVNQ